MGPRDSISTCLRKYATFGGRALRSEFWWFTGLATALSFALGGLVELLWANGAYLAGDVLDWAVVLLGLALFLPYLAVTVRRFHDVGLSGWLVAALWLGIFAAQGFAVTRQAIQLMASGDPFAETFEFVFDKPFIAALAITGLLILAEIAICLWPGTAGPNTHGPDPRAVTS